MGHQGLIASVAMVYDPGNTQNPVRFAVYDATGALTPYAALDNPGLAAIGNVNAPTRANIAVPENCLTCHGTSSSYRPGLSVANARFLPFDPSNARFSTSNTAYGQAAVLPQLRALNALVLQTSPGPAVTDFITNTYSPSVTDPSATTNLAYVPSGWTSGGPAAVEVYNEVVKPYCRTCHLSHDGPASWLTWSAFDGRASAISYYACSGSTSPMPQAERTQTLLWQSPARAYLANGLNIGGTCAP
jgi:hypothetical protein